MKGDEKKQIFHRQQAHRDGFRFNQLIPTLLHIEACQFAFCLSFVMISDFQLDENFVDFHALRY